MPMIHDLPGVAVNHSAPSLHTCIIRSLGRCDTLDVQHYIQVEVVNLDRRAASIVNTH